MSEPTDHPKQYSLLGMGGSFDHFHAGHEYFLQFAASQANKLLIGISTHSLIKHKQFSSSIESFETRANAVSRWCKENNVNAEVFPLHDPFGPTLDNPLIEAVAVTTETVPGGELINTERGKKNLPQLPLLVCKLVKDQNGQEIHASRIRAGEISRQGNVYKNLLKTNYRLHENHRDYFSRPQGPVSLQPKPNPLNEDLIRCAVGDFTVEYCLQNKVPFSLGVIDHKQQRQTYMSTVLDNLENISNVTNPAGEISTELSSLLVNKLEGIFPSKPSQPDYIHVEGEEDLAAVALFLLLPLGCEVWYGQPNEGTVVVTITEAFKNEVYEVLCS